MKANFKIENDESNKKEVDENEKNIKNIDELPKGGNLWSVRSKENK